MVGDPAPGDVAGLFTADFENQDAGVLVAGVLAFAQVQHAAGDQVDPAGLVIPFFDGADQPEGDVVFQIPDRPVEDVAGPGFVQVVDEAAGPGLALGPGDGVRSGG